jgi:translation initiation factor IF-2
MGVRLNKVLTELNIGLQTAVDYLKKKNLGEINDATMNTKISDEQYNALVKEFKGDKDEEPGRYDIPQEGEES